MNLKLVSAPILTILVFSNGIFAQNQNGKPKIDEPTVLVKTPTPTPKLSETLAKNIENLQKDEEIPREQYDSVILSVDPAVSAKPDADATGLVVLGKVGPEIRVLMANAQRVATHQLLEILDSLDRYWRPDAIVFETNAAFEGIKDLFVRHTGFGARIVGHNQHRPKGTRVAVFAVPVQNGTVRLKGRAGVVDAGQQALFDEMTSFPFGAHDDLLDATAAGTEHLLGKREPRLFL